MKAARGQTHDADRHSRFINRMIATFTADSINRARPWGDPDPRPVFVVGLPRSGTSLVEQVLASHSHVHGAGELHDLNRLFLDLPKITSHHAADPFAAWSELGPDTARVVTGSYLQCLERQAPFGSIRIIDKMPDNIWLVGMIGALWPRGTRDRLRARLARCCLILLANGFHELLLGERLEPYCETIGRSQTDRSTLAECPADGLAHRSLRGSRS